MVIFPIMIVLLNGHLKNSLLCTDYHYSLLHGVWNLRPGLPASP